jgi:transposase
MRRAYVFRLRPTARQHVARAACVEAHREVYNAALQERRDAWSHSKTRIDYGDQSAQLTEIRSARADQAVWSFSSQQATLRRLNKAFAGSSAGSSAVRKRGIRGLRVRPGSIRWSGLKMGTAHVGCLSSGGCICRASARSSFICTARWWGG